MRILAYANGPDKARLLLPWLQALSGHFLTEVTVQTTREPSTGEQAAVQIFREEITGTEKLVLRAVSTDGDWPEEAIAQEALKGDYNLVVLAPAGRRGFIRLFYGSMVAKVIRRVSTSVLVVRDGMVPPRRILVCVSGSRHSLTNVRAAAQLAVPFGASVTIMMVQSELPLEFSGADSPAGREDFLRSDHPLAVHLRAGLDLLHNLGAKGSVRIATGLVVDGILEEMEAFDHDLMVLGTHRAEDYDPMYEDLTSELVLQSSRSALVVGVRADLL